MYYNNIRCFLCKSYWINVRVDGLTEVFRKGREAQDHHGPVTLT